MKNIKDKDFEKEIEELVRGMLEYDEEVDARDGILNDDGVSVIDENWTEGHVVPMYVEKLKKLLFSLEAKVRKGMLEEIEENFYMEDKKLKMWLIPKGWWDKLKK